MSTNPHDVRFVFFGTAPLAHEVLESLSRAGLVPGLVVASRAGHYDKKGSKSEETIWAEARGIPVVEPTAIDAQFIESLAHESWDVFVVASYGKILPQSLLDIPRRGTLNVHPSLLPKWRGASPIRSAILADDKAVGVSVMLLDAGMDSGPLLAQKQITIADWPPHARELERTLAHVGGELLAQTLVPWIDGTIQPHDQNHALATFSKKIKKEDGLINLGDAAYANLLKIRAYEGWPGTYTFFERGGEQFRVHIVAAHLLGEKLVIDTVKPEGKREMPYADFMRSGATPVAL